MSPNILVIQRKGTTTILFFLFHNSFLLCLEYCVYIVSLLHSCKYIYIGLIVCQLTFLTVLLTEFGSFPLLADPYSRADIHVYYFMAKRYKIIMYICKCRIDLIEYHHSSADRIEGLWTADLFFFCWRLLLSTELNRKKNHFPPKCYFFCILHV